MSKVRVYKSKLHGYGVFATTDIRKGSIVDSCPFILLAGPLLNFPVTLQGYVYETETRNQYLLALGNGSLFNHSSEASAYPVQDDAKRLMRYRAARFIKAGEEVTIDYGSGYWA